MDIVSHDLIAADALSNGEYRVVSAGGWQILLVRVEGAYYAINDRCSHAASPLDGGRLRGKTIACPLHGARFDVTTGRCIGAGYAALATFPIRVEHGRVLADMPDRPPGVNERPLAIRR